MERDIACRVYDMCFRGDEGILLSEEYTPRRKQPAAAVEILASLFMQVRMHEKACAAL
jgi:hypothetical protein